MYSSAKKLQRILHSGDIRKTFIDYFTINHEHKFVRSSPVVPFCDPTVAFVNAGMNQFKSVFLGKTQAPHKRVTNSQKCVRVGGKHNDLSVVGQDSYHHTFFEMLGNWSFGDYFKREACEMALELLRGPYGIDTNRLYVTYFAGDKILDLPVDIECYDIWRSLGFPAERVLPFGYKDNFWEMGTSGPCGPCTEIHIDHRYDFSNSAATARAKLVNAGTQDLTELWNLVFIQYKRNEDGSITRLPQHHVDTGMGFERLTAVLQNKTSNYDTDLFTPIFEAIQKQTKAPSYSGSFPTTQNEATLDTGYRILADHVRMITVCLADGMLPDQNQKLRRILRKALTVSENIFVNENLLLQLVPIVVESLGVAYPEICTKQTAIMELIAHEQEVFKALRESSTKAFTEVLQEFPNLKDIDLMECPGFVPAYREFQMQKSYFAQNRVIPGKFLYKLSDTYGLTEEHFQKLAGLENMLYDVDGYKEELKNAKLRAKTNIDNQSDVLLRQIDATLTDLTIKLPATNNKPKYNYSYDKKNMNYNIPTVKTKIQGLLHNESVVENLKSTNIKKNDTIYIVTDASNFYYESGGQQSDIGKLSVMDNIEALPPCELKVIDVLFMNDCVIHVCKLLMQPEREFSLEIGSQVVLNVDAEHRKLNTCHHSACHLLNAAIRTLFKKVTYQVSSAVTSRCCKLEVGLIGKRITKDDVEDIEDLIGRIICSGTPLNVETITAADVTQQNDITMVPGEIYPEIGLRLTSIKNNDLDFQSKELCSGTHVTNTQEIEYFCITNLKQTNRARFAFTAVAGQAAENVMKTVALLRHRIDILEEELKTDKLTNATEVELQTIRHNMLHLDILLPYAFKMDTLERINDLLKKINENKRTTLKEFVEVEMKNLLQEKPSETHPYILHYITSSVLVEELPLQKATKLCPDRPILVISMCDNIVKARCCVPKKFISKDFNAEKWLKEFATTFNAQVTPPKGQNASEVCNMKGKKVISTQIDEQLEPAMERAKEFANRNLPLL